MINNYPITNIYEKPLNNSKLSSQMLYGEKFKVLSKKKGWLEIKTDFDNYIGYIKNRKYSNDFKNTHKINKKKVRIFKRFKKNFVPTNKFLYFASRIKKINQVKGFINFSSNNWLKKSDIKKINHIEKNFSKIIKLFLNTKYLWGGKSSLGIDCSALIQNFFNYNGIFFQRDTKDQIKSLKIIKKKNVYNKKCLIFWKGHVAYCLNKKSLIHAYGPKKKVLIMDINRTINEIKKKSNLEIIGTREINVN